MANKRKKSTKIFKTSRYILAKIVEPRIGSKSQCTSVLTGYTITADQGLNIVAFATNNSFENPNAYFENKLSDARISGYAVKKSYCKKNEMFGSILN